jgi:NAD(P)-dependent dehydrogenase (short-subunit alcohol dehydrogenase family)/AraC-like DNA-binding protein
MGALEGEVVLVTGGASGLGRAIVDRFLEEGAQLTVLDRSPDRLAELAEANPDRLTVVAGDVRAIADNQRAIEACVARFGKLDCAIGNAGIWDYSVSLDALPAEKLDAAFAEVFDVNVKGYLNLAKAALPAPTSSWPRGATAGRPPAPSSASTPVSPCAASAARRPARASAPSTGRAPRPSGHRAGMAANQAPPADVARHDVRMDGVFFFRTVASGDFVKALDPGNFSYCVMVRSGEVRLETDFPSAPQIVLAAGDAVAVSGLAPHAFTSLRAPAAQEPGRFERLALTGAEPGGDVELIVGVAPSESLALGSVLVGPIVVRPSEHPDLARRLWRAVEMLEDEYGDDSWIDRNLVIRRMAETMLINMSRRVFADRRTVPDVGRAPANRRIMHAINAFFAAPDLAWSLDDLARTAGMSRTRFAEEFKLVTGQTPGRIISRLRLTAAARRLTSAALSVEAAALEAGYSSAAAFVRAFQREFGETPARWRRQRLHRDAPRANPRRRVLVQRSAAEARRSAAAVSNQKR